MKKLILIIAASALIVGFIPACGKKDFVAEINALEQKIPDTNFEWKSRCQELSRMIKAYQNGQAIDKNRALGFAAAFGLPSLVEDLVENGADVNARFSRVSETETEILMEREIRSALKRRGETRSEAELRKQYREQARKRAEENARPILSGAIGTLSVECTEILLKHGANLREVDSESGVLAGVIYSLPPAEFFKRINEIDHP